MTEVDCHDRHRDLNLSVIHRELTQLCFTLCIVKVSELYGKEIWPPLFIGASCLWHSLILKRYRNRIPYSAASFLTYEQTLSFLNVVLPKQEDVISGKVDLLRRFLAGATAGSISTLVAYPIDLVRTRLAAQTYPDYKGHRQRPTSPWASSHPSDDVTCRDL